jgi:hypothetical protein
MQCTASSKGKDYEKTQPAGALVYEVRFLDEAENDFEPQIHRLQEAVTGQATCVSCGLY